MPLSLANLALQLVLNTLDRVLVTYPRFPHQQAFAVPELRQRLIAYVLNHIPSCYVSVDGLAGRDVPETTYAEYAGEQTEIVELFTRIGIDEILAIHGDLARDRGLGTGEFPAAYFTNLRQQAVDRRELDRRAVDRRELDRWDGLSMARSGPLA